MIAHGVTRGPAIEADPDEPGGDDTGLAAAA
jgi:hypothetical protein